MLVMWKMCWKWTMLRSEWKDGITWHRPWLWCEKGQHSQLKKLYMNIQLSYYCFRILGKILLLNSNLLWKVLQGYKIFIKFKLVLHQTSLQYNNLSLKRWVTHLLKSETRRKKQTRTCVLLFFWKTFSFLDLCPLGRPSFTNLKEMKEYRVRFDNIMYLFSYTIMTGSILMSAGCEEIDCKICKLREAII